MEDTTEFQPKFTDYDIYHEAGGVFDKDQYSLFKNAIEAESEFEQIHVKQDQTLAKQAILLDKDKVILDPDKVDVAVSAYAVLRDGRIPELADKIPVSDQEIFAQGILAIQGKDAYDTYREKLPHIFYKNKPQETKPQVSGRSSVRVSPMQPKS